MKQLCENCKYEFEVNDPELEFDELVPLENRWLIHEKTICDNCEEDLEIDKDDKDSKNNEVGEDMC